MLLKPLFIIQDTLFRMVVNWEENLEKTAPRQGR